MIIVKLFILVLLIAGTTLIILAFMGMLKELCRVALDATQELLHPRGDQ